MSARTQSAEKKSDVADGSSRISVGFGQRRPFPLRRGEARALVEPRERSRPGGGPHREGWGETTTQKIGLAKVSALSGAEGAGSRAQSEKARVRVWFSLLPLGRRRKRLPALAPWCADFSAFSLFL
ncbi:hypothetical protein TW95_gp1596 [Pandoravirus inopinatum]|uniref:Uncharacterized protein n=1 Tax=Pandoravirus inopinatum TaxID=1605721 RepID=A0A0B5J8Q4_9VIRU|nr:hypothetical protein TW95_gp1596 [Pandoravirus inopinatum]AJF98330.1 hypothetical protein [Pandoravirus inopinatum]